METGVDCCFAVEADNVTIGQFCDDDDDDDDDDNDDDDNDFLFW